MNWRERLRGDIESYFIGEGASHVVAALLSSVHTAEQVLAGRSDDDVRVGMAQLMIDFTVGLNSNPFWLKHSGYIMPVFSTGVSAWMDSMAYLDAKTPEDRVAFIATRNAMTEVAMAVLFCDQGAKGVREKGTDLRRVMLQHGDLSRKGK